MFQVDIGFLKSWEHFLQVTEMLFLRSSRDQDVVYVDTNVRYIDTL